MEFIKEIMDDQTHRVWLGVGLFFLSSGLLWLIYRFIIRHLQIRARKTKTQFDDFIIDLLRIPLLWVAIWMLLRIFSETFFKKTKFTILFSDLNDVFMIALTGWLIIKVIRLIFYLLRHKMDINQENNLIVRQNLTRMKIFEGIIVGIFTVLIVAVCLMTFEKVRTLGVSLLTSAGIAGIIVGLAAQKSIGAMLAGIQVAITQPIRLDDVVVVEGEWGRIEEITLTYVVVKIWDERRLVLPVTYFLEKPFQNWTRTTSSILGTVFLYVDYDLPVNKLREYLDSLLVAHPKWDRRVANIQVTDTKQNYKELRVLLSAMNSSVLWELRIDIREKLIDFINQKYPESFVKTRFANTSENQNP